MAQCDEPTEVYSRVTGFYRPVQNWNPGKTAEFLDRRTYRPDPTAAPDGDPADVALDFPRGRTSCRTGPEDGAESEE